MENLASLLDFVDRFVNSINVFTSSIYTFMTYKIAIWNNITIFEVLFGAGVSVYLTATIAKWLIDVVT